MAKMFLILLNFFFFLFNLMYGIYALKGKVYEKWSEEARLIMAIIHIALAIALAATVPVLIFIEVMK